MVEPKYLELAQSLGLELRPEKNGIAVVKDGKQIRFCFNENSLSGYLNGFHDVESASNDKEMPVNEVKVASEIEKEKADETSIKQYPEKHPPNTSRSEYNPKPFLFMSFAVLVLDVIFGFMQIRILGVGIGDGREGIVTRYLRNAWHLKRETAHALDITNLSTTLWISGILFLIGIFMIVLNRGQLKKIRRQQVEEFNKHKNIG